VLGAELDDEELSVGHVADELLDDVAEAEELRDCAPSCDAEVDILGIGIHLAPPTHDTAITTYNYYHLPGWCGAVVNTLFLTDLCSCQLAIH